MTRMPLFLALALAIWVVSTCPFAVTEAESVLVLRFGSPRTEVSEPGLHFKWPAPFETLLRVDQRIRVLEVEASEFLTADKKNVSASAFVAWSVGDPMKFVQSARTTEAVTERLRALVHTQTGNVIGQHPLDALLSVDPSGPSLAAVNEEIAERTGAEALATYGVNVEAARIQRLNFPAQNKKAVFRRMEEERRAIAKQIRAEGLEAAERIRADAELEAALLLSEAQRKAAELRGQGEAEAARIKNEAYARDPELYELLRKLDAYEKVLGEDSLIVVPSDSELFDLLEGWEPGSGDEPAQTEEP